jgi:hypothetical protein
MNHVRTYNSALSFASLGAKVKVFDGGVPYCYRIHGQTYHAVGPLNPNDNTTPTYAQLYVYDSEEANRIRMNNVNNSNLNIELLSQLDALLREINPFAEAFKMMKEIVSENGIGEVCMAKVNERTI